MNSEPMWGNDPNSPPAPPHAFLTDREAIADLRNQVEALRAAVALLQLQIAGAE